VFEVFNDNFPLYIKHEDLSEIAQVVNISTSLLYSCGFCKSVYIIVYYLTYCFKFIHNLLYFNNNRNMTETSMRAGNADVYRFLSHCPYKDLGNHNFN